MAFKSEDLFDAIETLIKSKQTEQNNIVIGKIVEQNKKERNYYNIEVNNVLYEDIYSDLINLCSGDQVYILIIDKASKQIVIGGKYYKSEQIITDIADEYIQITPTTFFSGNDLVNNFNTNIIKTIKLQGTNNCFKEFYEYGCTKMSFKFNIWNNFLNFDNIDKQNSDFGFLVKFYDVDVEEQQKSNNLPFYVTNITDMDLGTNPYDLEYGNYQKLLKYNKDELKDGYFAEIIVNLENFNKAKFFTIEYYENIVDFYGKKIKIYNVSNTNEKTVNENPTQLIQNCHFDFGYNLDAINDSKLFLGLIPTSNDKNGATLNLNYEKSKTKRKLKVKFLSFDDEEFITDFENTNYEIRWYKYSRGESVNDLYGKEHWILLNRATNSKGKILTAVYGYKYLPDDYDGTISTLNLDLNILKRNESYKAVIIDLESEEYWTSNTLSFNNIDINPNDNSASEINLKISKEQVETYVDTNEEGKKYVYTDVSYGGNYCIYDFNTPLNNDIYIELTASLKNSLKKLNSWKYIIWRTAKYYGEENQGSFQFKTDKTEKKYTCIKNLPDYDYYYREITPLEDVDEEKIYIMLEPIFKIGRSNKIEVFLIDTEIQKTELTTFLDSEIKLNPSIYQYLSFNTGLKTTNGTDYSLVLNFVSDDLYENNNSDISHQFLSPSNPTTIVNVALFKGDYQYDLNREFNENEFSYGWLYPNVSNKLYYSHTIETEDLENEGILKQLDGNNTKKAYLMISGNHEIENSLKPTNTYRKKQILLNCYIMSYILAKDNITNSSKIKTYYNSNSYKNIINKYDKQVKSLKTTANSLYNNYKKKKKKKVVAKKKALKQQIKQLQDSYYKNAKQSFNIGLDSKLINILVDKGLQKEIATSISEKMLKEAEESHKALLTEIKALSKKYSNFSQALNSKKKVKSNLKSFLNQVTVVTNKSKYFDKGEEFYTEYILEKFLPSKELQMLKKSERDFWGERFGKQLKKLIDPIDSPFSKELRELLGFDDEEHEIERYTKPQVGQQLSLLEKYYRDYLYIFKNVAYPGVYLDFYEANTNVDKWWEKIKMTHCSFEYSSLKNKVIYENISYFQKWKNNYNIFYFAIPSLQIRAFLPIPVCLKTNTKLKEMDSVNLFKGLIYNNIISYNSNGSKKTDATTPEIIYCANRQNERNNSWSDWEQPNYDTKKRHRFLYCVSNDDLYKDIVYSYNQKKESSRTGTSGIYFPPNYYFTTKQDCYCVVLSREKGKTTGWNDYHKASIINDTYNEIFFLLPIYIYVDRYENSSFNSLVPSTGIDTANGLVSSQNMQIFEKNNYNAISGWNVDSNGIQFYDEGVQKLSFDGQTFNFNEGSATISDLCTISSIPQQMEEIKESIPKITATELEVLQKLGESQSKIIALLGLYEDSYSFSQMLETLKALSEIDDVVSKVKNISTSQKDIESLEADMKSVKSKVSSMEPKVNKMWKFCNQKFRQAFEVVFKKIFKTWTLGIQDLNKF